jgi:hypothetical protein
MILVAGEAGVTYSRIMDALRSVELSAAYSRAKSDAIAEEALFARAMASRDPELVEFALIIARSLWG